MKNILIFGAGETGLSAYKTLDELKILTTIYDSNEKVLNELSNKGYKVIRDDELLEKLPLFDCLLKSPGIHPDHKIIRLAKSKGLKVISDLELLFMLFPNRKYITITGTNGKTTCSSLLHHILTDAGLKSHLIGNIGVGMLWAVFQAEESDYFIIETSSFQLHDSYNIKPWIATITNIKPDHLDWHGNYTNYINDKLKIFSNQDSDDYSIINIDDPLILDGTKELKSQKKEISLVDKTDDFYFHDEKIYFGIQNQLVVDFNDMKIKGIHNVQNTLIASSIANIVGVPIKQIEKSLKTFTAIEHRLEYVNTINEVTFYNDSKATNPDSTIKALQSFKQVILIAGGYDKQVDLSELFGAIKKGAKALILFGETKYLFEKEAIKENISNTFLVDSLDEAVEKAFSISQPGDTVLFSPASASWDMYKNFEERGNHFKKIVHDLGD